MNRLQQETKKMPEEGIKTVYECECGSTYYSRNGIWKHKKKCEKKSNKIEEETKTPEKEDKMQQILLFLKESKEVQDFLVQQNKELKEQIMELSKPKENVINNTQNNTFNLQVFLNEDCKDAMNLTEFLDYIKCEIEHLDNVGRFGFVKANSDLIIQNLKKIGLYKRPIHCTDKKRNNHYVKDNDKWEKDTNNEKIMDFVKKVGKKNYDTNLNPWRKANPEYGDSKSKQNDIFCKMMCEFCDEEKCENVVKNIDKIITIEKKGDKIEE
jgi:hypothetical protein